MAKALKLLGEAEIRSRLIEVPFDWWSSELVAAGLDAAPLRRFRNEPAANGDLVRVSRAQVFNAAATTGDDEQAILGLFWLVLAWGAGPRLRLCRKRIGTVARDPARAVELLRASRALAASDPRAAYKALLADGRPALRYWGAAFFSKWLYFAGAGNSSHPCLILDARVAASMRHAEGWTGLRSSSWSPGTYASYCSQVKEWAAQLTLDIGRPVRPDEVELWLFEQSLPKPAGGHD